MSGTRPSTTWTDIHIPAYPALESDTEADVVVVGGGIAGVTSAYLLAREGFKVVLLEADRIARGVTAYTTAFLTEVIDTELADLLKMFGPKKARLAWQSGADAIDAIEEMIGAEGIECEFVRCPLYSYANSDEEFSHLEAEHDTAGKLHLETLLRRKPLRGFDNYGCLEVPCQAKFHPLKFVAGLARAAHGRGAAIYEQARVASVSEEEGGVVVKCGRHSVRSKELIVATYAPFYNDLVTFLKKGMYKSYVLETRVPQGALREGLYEDTANPYHYFRVDPQKGHDRLIIGGEDHREELPMDEEKNFAALEDYLRRILGETPYAIVRRWSSFVLEPSDGLALIGRLKSRQLAASAFSGNGMTYAVISAILFRDILKGERNPWAELYDPQRIPTLSQIAKKAFDYTEEFFGGAVKNAFARRQRRA